MKSKAIYLGKKVGTGAQVWRFSHFEGLRLLSFLRQILDEIHTAFPKPGLTDKLIPFFAGREQQARARPKKDDRISFWDDAHVTATYMRARLIFNDIQGEFELHILSPVPSDIVKLHKGM